MTDLKWKNHEIAEFSNLPKVTSLLSGQDRKANTHTHTVSGELGAHILSRSLTRPNMAAGD